MRTRVSVIVPIYNVEKYIHRCVDSVLNQTCPDVELILVDDGSPDRCPQICDEYARKDPRVKVIHKVNGGVSAARNTGIEAAAGDFLTFLDGDDYAEERLIETATAKIGQADVIIWGYFVDFFDKEEKMLFSRTEALAQGTYETGKMETQIIDDHFTGVIGYIWNKMYRTDLIKKNGIRFDSNVSIGEDMIFNSAALSAACTMAVISDPLIHYIQRPRLTLGTKYYDDYFAVRLLSWKALRNLITSWGLPEKHIMKISATAGFGMLKSTAKRVSNADSLTVGKKKAYLSNVFSSKDAREILKYHRSESMKDRFISSVMKTKNSSLIYSLYKGRK